jgi:hypothetical protein
MILYYKWKEEYGAIVGEALFSMPSLPPRIAAYGSPAPTSTPAAMPASTPTAWPAARLSRVVPRHGSGAADYPSLP